MSNHHHLQDILLKAENGTGPSRQNIVDLLNLENTQQIQMLFESARKIREQHFHKRIFLYGFLYTSTYCRND